MADKHTRMTVVFPFDPAGSKVGGAETFIKGVIKYAPEDFHVEVVGITSDPHIPLRQPAHLKLGRREFVFFPLFLEREENQRTAVPLSLRFTFSLAFHWKLLQAGVLFFNRVEPVVLARYSSRPKIVMIHNDVKRQLDNKEVLWSRIPGIYFAFERYLFAGIDQVYTVSRNSLEYYHEQDRLSQAKYAFLPTWVDDDVFFPLKTSKTALREKLISRFPGVSSVSRWVLFVGRLQPQKVPKRVVDAFLEYRRQDASAVLLMVGEGDLRQECEEYVRTAGGQENVVFLGNQPSDVILELYNAADVLLLASDYEGMPICVLEALGCGLPVVSTNVGEVGRVVKNGYSGEIVNSFSAGDIGKTLGHVLSDLDIYTKDNCLATVEDYRPQKVLSPVYERIRQLYNERFVDGHKT